MRDNLQLSNDTLRGASGIIIGALSGLITGVAAGADLFAVRNILAVPVAVPGIRLRWAPVTAFGTAQALALACSKVYGFTAIHTTGGKAVQAHNRSAIVGDAVGARIALTEISAYIALTGAITGATYTAEDADEPDVFAVGASSLSPGLYEDWSPIDGLPQTLAANTGFVIKNVVAMGASGAGLLFVGIDGFRPG
jgi:hypothetical protein